MDPSSLVETPQGVVVDHEPPVAVDVDLDAVAADLDGVDTALRRLDDGTYGTCEVCAATLADEHLAADPVARRCPEHLGAPTPPAIVPPPPPPPPPPPT